MGQCYTNQSHTRVATACECLCAHVVHGLARAAVTLLLIGGCASMAPTAKRRSSEYVVATLKRTSCLGHCPSYTVTVWSTGAVRWSGRSMVAVRGEASATLDAVHLEELRELFDRARWFELGERFDCNEESDEPYVMMSYCDGTRSHSRRRLGAKQAGSQSPGACCDWARPQAARRRRVVFEGFDLYLRRWRHRSLKPSPCRRRPRAAPDTWFLGIVPTPPLRAGRRSC